MNEIEISKTLSELVTGLLSKGTKRPDAVIIWNANQEPSLMLQEARPGHSYASHYGGRCRGCADENGVCPTSGLPCDPGERLKAAAHCLKAWQYGIEHGHMDNPFLPAPAENLEPLGTVVGLIDWNGATASVINAELPARSPVYGVPPAPASVVMVPQSAIDWLLGEGPDAAGSHFGDDIPERAPRYWWRSHFRELIAARQPNVLAPVDAKERKE